MRVLLRDSLGELECLMRSMQREKSEKESGVAEHGGGFQTRRFELPHVDRADTSS